MTAALEHDNCSDCHEDEHRGQLADRADGGACDACHTVQGFMPPTYSIRDHQQSDYPLTGSHRAVPCFLCHTQQTAPDGETYAKLSFESTSCRSCHEDIHQGQLDLWIEKEGCAFCHTTDTWHRTSFDHDLARFPLEGKHREILCLECHTIETDQGGQQVWMKPLEMTCVGCHKDPHMGQFAEASHGMDARTCGFCHTPLGWERLQFDHDRDTGFALTGGHANVACGQCHEPVKGSQSEAFIRYRPTDTACIACHGNTEENRQ
jgi:hypothetical protein